MKQLAQSYEDFDCFKHFEMLLDIQNVFKEPRGGLSGLTKVNKTMCIGILYYKMNTKMCFFHFLLI